MDNHAIGTPESLTDALAKGWEAWLGQQTREGMTTVLIHTEEGVTWGRAENGAVIWARDAFAPSGTAPYQVNSSTLIQLRLFGPAGEIWVWRSRNGLQARRIEDGATPQADVIEETQWLWGTATGRAANGFYELVEGMQGYSHTPPLDHLAKNQRVGLHVRHYVTYDEEGRAAIRSSRLVELVKI